MKKVFFLLAIILLVSGQVMCTSCGSSNDEYENKISRLLRMIMKTRRTQVKNPTLKV